MIDLHMHSIISDGSYKVEELIFEAKKRQLKVIAITDHDTYYDFSSQSDDELIIFGGMEISAYDYEVDKKVHLLVYGNKLQLINIHQVIKNTLSMRHQNSLRQLAMIKAHGYNIDENKLKMSHEQILYKQHIMEALKEGGYTDSLDGTLYKKLFKGDGIAVGDITYPDVLDVLNAASLDHVFIVLAHPELSDLFDRVGLYVSHGLKGIETYHGLSSIEGQKIAHELALRYTLVETIGSDFHGIYGIEPMLGTVDVSKVIQEKCYETFLHTMKLYGDIEKKL